MGAVDADALVDKNKNHLHLKFNINLKFYNVVVTTELVATYHSRVAYVETTRGSVHTTCSKRNNNQTEVPPNQTHSHTNLTLT